MRIIFLVVVVFLLFANASIAGTLSNYAGPVQAPDQCHYLSFKRDSITGDKARLYSPSLSDHISVDIVCIGDTVTIDSPILSNGGDVIIFAGSVHIAAPIDTRVYINHTSLDHFENRIYPPEGGYYHESDGALMDGPNQGLDDRYYRSFIAYYEDCIDCKVIDSKTWIPRAPSGLTPAYKSGPQPDPHLAMKDGYAPFDTEIDFNKLRGGNVYIVSSKVSIDEKLRSPNPPPINPICGSEGFTYIPYAIDVRGMTGGKGGAGTPSTCTTYKPTHYMFDCGKDNFLVAGKTGPGGRGGDAGSIVFVRIGTHWSQKSRAELELASSVEGGSPGDNKSLRSPTARGDYAARGQYCDFYKRPDSDYPLSSKGQDGSRTFSMMDASAALRFVGQLIQSKDAKLDYNFSELAARATSNITLAQLNFDDYLSSRLAESLGNAEVKTIAAVRQILMESKIDKSLLVAPHLAGLVADQLVGKSLSDRTRVFARQLTDFSAAGVEPPILDYLFTSGGLLNIANSRPLNRFYAEAARIDNATQNQLLSDLKTQLVNVGATLAEIEIREERSERLAALAEIKRRIDTATRATEDNIDIPFATKLADALKDAGGAAVAMYASYQSGNVVGLLGSSGQFISAVDRVRNIWSAYGAGGDSLPGLRNAMRELQADYVQFLAAAAGTRRDYRDARLLSLDGALRNRVSGASRLEVRHAQFNDLLRISVVSYLVDPALSKRTFENNFDSLRVFLISFPRIEPYLQLRDVSLECVTMRDNSGNRHIDDRCFDVGPSSKTKEVIGLFGTPRREVVLYVVAPHKTSISLPKFGLKVRIKYASLNDSYFLTSLGQGTELLDIPFP